MEYSRDSGVLRVCGGIGNTVVVLREVGRAVGRAGLGKFKKNLG